MSKRKNLSPMIKRLTRYACVISFVGMITVVLPDVSLACTEKDLQKWEQQAAEAIVVYKQKEKEFADHVKTFAYNDQARVIEKQKTDQLAKVQNVHDGMAKAGCLAKSKLKWPIGIK